MTPKLRGHGLIKKRGEDMDNVKERRKKYLVNRKLQLQFVWLLLLQVSIPLILLGSSLYIVNKSYLLSIQMMVGETALSDAYIQSTLNFSILAVVVLLTITAILLTFIGVRFSHHVAGPLYKLEDAIDRLAKGEKVERIHFRKTDALGDFAEKFNTVIERLNQAK